MTDTTYQDLRYEQQDQVAIITFDRPGRMNAMGDRLKEEIADAMHRADADPDVRAIVITGAGAAFCSGGDVKEMSEGRSGGAKRSIEEKIRPSRDGALLAIYEARKPVIAAVNGAAAG